MIKDKKRCKPGTLFKAYYYPTGREYYFDWRPTIKDLQQLCFLNDLDGDGRFDILNFEIKNIEIQKAANYNLKLV